MNLGTPAIPTSQLFLDNAFSVPNNNRRRRLSHQGGADQSAGSGLYALATSCPALKAAARVDAQAVMGVAAATLWSEEKLSPMFPLTCINVTTQSPGSAAGVDAKLFEGYYNDDQTSSSASKTITEFVGAWDFRGTDANRFQVDVLYNDTNQAGRRGGGPPRLVRVNAPLNFATNTYLHKRFNGVKTAKMQSVRMMPQPARSLNLDFASLLGPLFYVWLLQLLFPVGLAAIVYEKEQKLRTMMKMMGMVDMSYWLVTYLWNLLVYLIFALVLFIGGNLIDLTFFKLNDSGIQFLFYFLYGNLQVVWTMLVSTIFTKAKTATVASYLWVFLSGCAIRVLRATHI